MKRILILLVFLFVSQTNAQGIESVHWIAKFGAAGGFTPMVMFPNFDALNQSLSGFGVDKFDSGLITYGGGGYAYIMLIDNVRIGGFGFGGSKNSEKNFQNFRKEVNYSIGGGAFTIEYTLPFIKGMAVSVGGLIGGGSIQIDVYQNEGSFDWFKVWNNLSSGNSKNIHKHLEDNFFTFAPTLNVDVPLNRFIAFRLGAGYQITFGNNWTVDNNQELNNVPSDLNGNTFFIQTGVFIGLFAF